MICYASNSWELRERRSAKTASEQKINLKTPYIECIFLARPLRIARFSLSIYGPGVETQHNSVDLKLHMLSFRNESKNIRCLKTFFLQRSSKLPRRQLNQHKNVRSKM